MVLAWEKLQWGFCDAVFYSLLFDVIHHPSVNYHQVFTPILYFQPRSSQSGPRHFHFNLFGPFSVTVLLQALQFWVSFFYPQVFFILGSFSTFLAQSAFIMASLRASISSSKFAGLHADPRNTDPVHLFVWVTTIHKSSMVVGFIYGLQQTGYVKNLLLTRFELFSRQAQ